MKIFPAIDLFGGQAVRLYQGDYNQMTVYDPDPLNTVKQFEAAGASHLHLVDLEGAKTGQTTNLPTIQRIAAQTGLFVEVGGGINTLDDFDRVLKCGADKVSVNSGAIRDPDLIRQAALRYGSQCVVLSADVKRVDGQFRVFGRGGRDDTGMEAIAWIKKCVDLGAGEIVVNSIDTDGVKGGFDLEMLDAVCNAVSVPVIASGGAGKVEDFTRLFQTLPGVDAGLAASVFHFGQIAIPDLKAELRKNGIVVR